MSVLAIDAGTTGVTALVVEHAESASMAPARSIDHVPLA